MLGDLPVPGRPTNFDCSTARAYCACSRCGWGCVDIFSLVYHFFLAHLSLLRVSFWDTEMSVVRRTCGRTSVNLLTCVLYTLEGTVLIQSS